MHSAARLHKPRIAAEAESDRLAAVWRYDILDTPPDGSFDRITALAADLFSVPISIVSLVDHDRIWFKSHHGLDVEQIDRAPGLCASAILHSEPWVLVDAQADIRALANPLVAGEFGLRFYVGVPLRTTDGFNLGTLCVIDHKPRPVTDQQIAHLKHLASVVMDQMELRLSARRAISNLSHAVDEKDAAIRRAELLAKVVDHRVKNSLQMITRLLRLQRNALVKSEASEQLALAANRVAAVMRVHHHLYAGDSDGSIDCRGYLQRLCDDFSATLRPNQPAIGVEVIEAALPRTTIVSLGLIVAELVTNAAKHGTGSIRPCGRKARSIQIWDSNGFGCVIHSGSAVLDPTMLTRMTDDDWAVVLEVFRAVRSQRGDKGRDDRRFLEALHYFTLHNITWRALPAEFGPWNSVWKRFWRLSQTGTFEAFFQALAECSRTAGVVQMFDSTSIRAHVSAAGAKGGSRGRRSAARAVGSAPRSTSNATLPAIRSTSTSPAMRQATAGSSRRSSPSARR